MKPLLRKGLGFFLIRESQNVLRWKGPQGSSSPTLKGTAHTGIKHNLRVSCSRLQPTETISETRNLILPISNWKMLSPETFPEAGKQRAFIFTVLCEGKESSAEQRVQNQFEVRRVGILSRSLCDPGRTHFLCA